MIFLSNDIGDITKDLISFNILNIAKLCIYSDSFLIRGGVDSALVKTLHNPDIYATIKTCVLVEAPDTRYPHRLKIRGKVLSSLLAIN